MIIDHIEKYEYLDDGSTLRYEARMALARLTAGMFGLHKETMKIELQARKKANKDDIVYAISGSILDNFPMAYLSCVFQWYAVSACNYAQLVGWLETRDTKLAKSYVKKAMPRLVSYRNKIAAHMSITAPYNEDNQADQASSLLTQVVYAKGRLCAGALAIKVQDGDEDVTVSKKLSWSLTEEHRQLSKRYWPNGQPKAYQGFMIKGKTARKLTVNDPKLYD